MQYVVLCELETGKQLFLHNNGLFDECDCDQIWWTESRVRALRRACALGVDVGYIEIKTEPTIVQPSLW